MPARFVSVDRATPLLLPPSIQDWLPEDHPARLVVDLVESLDLQAASVNHKGTGSEQYPPSMLLSLLLYNYSGGVFSSREIEKATYDDVGVRYICAEHHPDHDTICTFRRNNAELIRSTFTQSLQLAAQVGLIRLGQLEIAFDGSKLEANAASRARTTVREVDAEITALKEQEHRLNKTIDKLLDEAENTDRREEKNRSPIPAELSCPEARVMKLREARKLLARKERRRAKLEAARAALSERKQERHDRREAQRSEIKESDLGSVPRSLPTEVEENEGLNLSDPESVRLRGDGASLDGYNGQASVDMGESGLIVGSHVCTESSDRQQLEANIAEVETNLGTGSIAVAVADKGYDNTYQIDKIEKNGGPVMLCEQQGDANAATGGKSGKRSARERATNQKRRELKARLELAENRSRRSRRKTTVEPTFGIIKEQMGYRRCRLRGEEKVDLDWRLVSFGFNLRKLSRNESWKAAMKSLRSRKR